MVRVHLGLPVETSKDKNPLKERKRLFSNEVRDKPSKVVRVHLGLPSKLTACSEIFDFVKSEIRKRVKFFDRSKSEIFTS